MHGESEQFNQLSHTYYTCSYSLDIKYSGSIITIPVPIALISNNQVPKYFTCFYNLDLKYLGGAFGPHADFMQGESEHFNQLSHTSNHDDFIISDFATSDTSGTSNPTRPPRPTRPTRHGFSRPPHPSSDHFSDHFTTSGFGHSTPSQSHGEISHPSMYSTNTLFL